MEELPPTGASNARADSTSYDHQQQREPPETDSRGQTLLLPFSPSELDDLMIEVKENATIPNLKVARLFLTLRDVVSESQNRLAAIASYLTLLILQRGRHVRLSKTVLNLVREQERLEIRANDDGSVDIRVVRKGSGIILPGRWNGIDVAPSKNPRGQS